MGLDIFFMGKVISKSKYLDGLSKFKGLMFSKRLKKNNSVVLVGDNESRFSLGIHMLFVFFPLDLVFLDSNKKVVDVRSARPFISFITPKKKSKYVIEMNRNENILKIGDKVDFKF